MWETLKKYWKLNKQRVAGVKNNAGRKISSYNHDHSAILPTREGLEYTIYKIRKKRHGVSRNIHVREAAQTVSEDWLTGQVDKSKLETCLVGYLTAKGTKGESDLDAYFIGNKSLKSNWYVLVSTVSLEWIQLKQALVSRDIPEISMKQRLFILEM